MTEDSSSQIAGLVQTLETLYQTRRYDLQIQYSRNLLALDINNFHGHLYLALGLHNSFKYAEEAAEVCRKAITLWPENSTFYRLLHYYYLGKGGKDYLKARDLLLKAIALSPEHAGCYRCLGEIYLINWEPDKARNYLAQAVRLDPDNAEFLARLALSILRCKEPQKAVELAKKALSMDASDLKVINSAGMVFLFSGELDLAEDLFKRVLREDPTREYYQKQLQNCISQKADRERRKNAGKSYNPWYKRQKGRNRFFDESDPKEAPGSSHSF